MESKLSLLLGLPEPTVGAVLEKLGDLSEDSTQQVLDKIQQRLEGTGSEAGGGDPHQATAQLQFENTRLENEVHRLNKNVGQLKSLLESAKGEASAAQKEAQAGKAAQEQQQYELQAQRGRSASLETQMAQLREQAEQLRGEKRDLLQQVAERRDQLDDRAAEVGRLNEIVQDLRTQRAADQDELARLRSQTSVSDVSEHMLKQSLELARNQVKWLDEELVKTQTEMQQARSELGRAVTTGRAETTRLRGEIESLGEQLSELSERNTELERRLRSKLEGERQAKEELAEQAEQFKREMAAQKKLCGEWEQTTEAAKRRVRSVEDSLRELENHQRSSDARAQEAVALMEQQVADAEQACSAAQARISELESQLETANRLLDDGGSARLHTQLLSPTASAASRVHSAQGSLNITQLYTEKVALEDRLKGADTEIASLRESMEQILAEIEERGPIIAAERDEYQRLVTDADRIAQDLASVRQDNVAKDQSLRSTKKECELLRRQLAAEQQQTRDLSRQVTRMLRAVEEARMGGRPMPEINDASSAGANPLASPMARRAARTSQQTLGVADPSAEQDEQWLNDVDRVISQKLVTFVDISDLVAQNRRLLRTTRELAAQAAQDEEQHQEDDEEAVRGALEQAEAMLDRLSTELDGTKTRLGVVERERDMLKALAGRKKSSSPEEEGDSVVPPPVSESDFGQSHSAAAAATAPSADAGHMGSGGDLVQLQADFDTYKSETRKTRAQLEREVTRLQSEASEQRVRAAKAEAQTEFDADRMQMFTRDLELRQSEVDHLRLATARLHQQAESYERQLESTTQTMTEERVELSRLRRQTTLLEAECESLRQNEQRWRNDEQRQAAERASLTQILENTTRMRDEWQRASDSQADQIRERLESTRKEADDLRQELRQVRDDGERARFRFDSELREVRGQVQQRDEKAAQLQEQIQSGIAQQTQIEAQRRELELERDALQRQIAGLEQRIQSQEALMQRAQGQGNAVSRESLLAVQLQDTRSQLEALQSEAETTTKRAEDYRTMSAANEASLQELTATYDRFKADQEQTVAALKSSVADLEANLEHTRTELARSREELETASSAAQAAQAELRDKEAAHATRVSQLEAEVDQKARALKALHDDMKRHEETTQGVQEQYEREIVAHAKDIEGALLVREKLHESQRRLATATAELEAAKEAGEASQSEIKAARDKAAQDVQAAENRLAEIKRQNALLLAHLESLGHQVPNVTVDPEVLANAATTADGAGQEGGLRDVVMYLRRERDLATAQLELAQQESQRWKKQSTHTQRMLDEARSELMQYAPADSDAQTDGQQQPGANGQRPPATGDVIPAGDGPITLSATQRQACRQQVEQAQLLRESNTVLRTELNSARGRLRSTEKELSRVRDQEVPQLRTSNASLRAELDAVRDQAKQLQEMCDHWKQRHEKVLAKYQMIEPEEHEALKREKEQLRTELEQLSSDNAKLQQQLSVAAERSTAVHSRRAGKLQSEIAQLKAQVEALSTQLEDERSKAQGQAAQAGELRAALGEAQAEAERAEKERQLQKGKFDRLHKAFQSLRTQSVEKLEQSSEAIKAHEATIQALNSQLAGLNTQDTAAEAGAEAEKPAEAEKSAEAASPPADAEKPAGTERPEADTETSADDIDALKAEIAALTRDKNDAVAAQRELAASLEQAQRSLEEARAEAASRPQPETGSGDEEVARLRAELAAAQAKAAALAKELDELKAKCTRYVRDNKTLQIKARELEKKLGEQGDVELQAQVANLQTQLAESKDKIEAAQATAKKSAELRSMLKISQATKRADDLERQVTELKAKIGSLEEGDGAASLKRPHDAEDTARLHTAAVRQEASQFTMPALSPTMTQGGISRWEKKEGEAFSAGDLLLQIETDKAQMDVEAQDDGVLVKILAAEGSQNVAVNSPIAIIAEDGDDISAIDVAALSAPKKAEEPAAEAPAEPEKKAAPAKAEASAPVHSGDVSAQGQLSPAVAFAIHANHIANANEIQGSGPKGRILKGDVLSFLKSGKARVGQSAKAAAAAASPAAPAPASALAPTPTPTPKGSLADAETAFLVQSLEPSVLRHLAEVEIAKRSTAVQVPADKLVKVAQANKALSVDALALRAAALALQQVSLAKDGNTRVGVAVEGSRGPVVLEIAGPLAQPASSLAAAIKEAKAAAQPAADTPAVVLAPEGLFTPATLPNAAVLVVGKPRAAVSSADAAAALDSALDALIGTGTSTGSPAAAASVIDVRVVSEAPAAAAFASKIKGLLAHPESLLF
ncbi:hypothetical protein GGF46_003182 [Coemansia sp. RSA 552]|nr:hypothetical protein GGF46_003182 [Coemansia sp. RSA 552]